MQKRDNNGTTWEKITIEPKNSRVYDAVLHNQLIIASTDEGIYRSTDNGSTWTSVTNNLPIQPSKIFATNLLYVNNTMVACVTGKGLYSSTNSGDSWQEVNSGFDVANFVMCTLVYDNNMYIGTSSNGIYVSTNNGLNWRTRNDGFSTTNAAEKSIRVLISHQGNIVAGTGNGVFISSNNGVKWSPTPTKIPELDPLCMATKNKSLFVGTERGLFVTSDNGMTWEKLEAEFSSFPIERLAILGDQMFVGTYGGLLYTRNVFEIISNVNVDNTLPSTWCSPNPATEIITITTPPILEKSTGVIRYSVVNLQGEEVMHTESDSKNISIPIHDFASGVYTIVATCGLQRTTTMVSIVQ
ncbi:MAG: T9SS type A sorting domain-containing protein [Candidatus Kapabacteria bacterium]|nr:T9SS type A sorting domain-containing protein [Candidatus Kapabacteria bacterium]